MHLNPKSKIANRKLNYPPCRYPLFLQMWQIVFLSFFHSQNLFSSRNVHFVIPDFFEGIIEDVSECVLFTVDRTAWQNAAVPVNHRFRPREHTAYPLLLFC